MAAVAGQDEAKPEEDLHFCGLARNYFNMEKVEGQGRLKLLKSSDVSMTMADELLKWAFESKIQEISTQQAQITPY